MREIAGGLVDRFARHGCADIVRVFAYSFPMKVIAKILGVPTHDMDRFKRWSDDMSARFGPLPDRLVRAVVR